VWQCSQTVCVCVCVCFKETVYSMSNLLFCSVMYMFIIIIVIINNSQCFSITPCQIMKTTFSYIDIFSIFHIMMFSKKNHDLGQAVSSVNVIMQ